MERKKTQHRVFKVWGCLAYCKNKDPKRTKLGLKGIRCVFVGCTTNNKAYRLLHLESNIVIESRDVKFFENLLMNLKHLLIENLNRRYLLKLLNNLVKE